MWKTGAVHMNVANLDRTTQFYQDTVGLRLHQRDDTTASLGAGSDDLLVLTERSDGIPSQGGTGLFHFALLVPSRLDLARVLAHFATTRTPLQGMSDHLVSEAIYFADPEGNGIEIYADRPRETWDFEPDGTLKMATLPLDVDDLLAELSGQQSQFTGMPTGTVMGHVHLHVADIPQAEAFYRDILGFDLMVRYSGVASFLSYEGYHHHLGINVWRRGQPSTIADNMLGLRWFELRVPQARLSDIKARLDVANININPVGDGYLVRDPFGNGVLLRAEPTSA